MLTFKKDDKTKFINEGSPAIPDLEAEGWVREGADKTDAPKKEAAPVRRKAQ